MKSTINYPQSLFPYGMQKLFGWFDNLGGGVGIKACRYLEMAFKQAFPLTLLYAISKVLHNRIYD